MQIEEPRESNGYKNSNIEKRFFSERQQRYITWFEMRFFKLRIYIFMHMDIFQIMWSHRPWVIVKAHMIFL